MEDAGCTAGGYKVRPFRDGDAAALVDLWNEVFGAGGERRTRQEWEWLYDRNPCGRQVVVAAEDRGRLIAHYGGLPLRYQVAGDVMVAALVVDSMVSADHRSGLRREGVFLRTARDWFARYSDPQLNAIHYGFPNRRAFPIGRRFLAYEPFVAPIPALYRNFFEDGDDDAVGGGEAEGLAVVEVPRLASAPLARELDELWLRLAPRYPFAIVRDSRFAEWRHDQPHWLPHRRFVLRSRDGSLRGWFVARERWQSQPILAVIDLLAAPDDAAAIGAILRRATALARATGHGRIELWLPDTHPTFRHALAAGFHAEPGLHVMVLQLRTDRVTREQARSQCYYTIADSDVW